MKSSFDLNFLHNSLCLAVVSLLHLCRNASSPTLGWNHPPHSLIRPEPTLWKYRNEGSRSSVQPKSGQRCTGLMQQRSLAVHILDVVSAKWFGMDIKHVSCCHYLQRNMFVWLALSLKIFLADQSIKKTIRADTISNVKQDLSSSHSFHPLLRHFSRSIQIRYLKSCPMWC